MSRNDATDAFDPLIDAAPSRFVVGIDLGTTNSAATYIDTEENPWQIRVLLIPQQVSATELESLDTLPSFYFQPTASATRGTTGNPGRQGNYPFFVGEYARDEAAKTSGRGIASAKSWLCHAGVDRTAALLPWHGADDVQRLSPLEVSAAYVDHIRQAWNRQFPNHPLEQQDVILTLPASFDEVARELTVSAAALAGLPRVVLIEEPQAAFYAWVYKHQTDWESRVEVGQTILVCDIGGGTTDFSLIRVRKSTQGTQKTELTDEAKQRIQFHRVAVGKHLILGGDNLDLAIAKHIEQKLTGGAKLEPYQWDVLVGISRNAKEHLLSDGGVDSLTINLPSRGSKLIGGSLQTEIRRDEIRSVVLNGFLPTVSLDEIPLQHQSGFQEFGLPYASDAAITRYLAEFLTTHASAGLDDNTKNDASVASQRPTTYPAGARPDVILFNGGFFASPILRETVIQQIAAWFQTANDPHWQPTILENDRLDLAVARGAAYYGMVRRDQGVRIAATLARSYYIGIGGNPVQAICIMPGSAEPGQTFTLADRNFQLTLSQPVEFSLYVSSIRLADQPGQILDVDAEQMTPLPPIRTVLQTDRRNEKRDVQVRLKIGLTEIGTIDLSCQELDSKRSWKLQFDVRSTTQTDIAQHLGRGESEGVVDELLWDQCAAAIATVFANTQQKNFADPKQLVNQLAGIIGADRDHWPMSLLRRIWESLIEHEAGRAKSVAHELRWLNLIGFSLRPGYGVALDDWRVTETWRAVHGKFKFGSANIRNESLVLWRRLAGGLTRGQQTVLADAWLASLRSLARQVSGKPVKGNVILLRPEESVEVWRLMGSLELLEPEKKHALGDLIISLIDKPRLTTARNAMVWALGRLGQRRPVFGPLNTVLPADVVAPWIKKLIDLNSKSLSHNLGSSVDLQSAQGAGIGANNPLEHLAVVQMSRQTDDRYRDVDSILRPQVIAWLEMQHAAEHLIDLVREVGLFNSEEQGRVFGESLPPGLRLE